LGWLLRTGRTIYEPVFAANVQRNTQISIAETHATAVLALFERRAASEMKAFQGRSTD
jgi:hypothetical protein